MSKTGKKPLDYDKPDLPLRIFLTGLKSLLHSRMGKRAFGFFKHRLSPTDGSWIEITHLPLVLPRLPKEFHQYRLVQISDFHYGTWLDELRLMEAIQLVNQQQPDLVAITGDFVTHDPDLHTPPLVRSLRQLEAKDGIVAVLGNHDHWSDPVSVRNILQLAGIRELKNSVFNISRNQATLYIAGVDDYVERQAELEPILNSLPSDGATVLLAHEPDFATLSARTGHFGLQISGHTHGGQVRLPFVGAVILPQHGKKYPCGKYQVGDMILYTNRGLGMAELDIRFHCDAEITVYRLLSPSIQQDSF